MQLLTSHVPGEDQQHSFPVRPVQVASKLALAQAHAGQVQLQLQAAQGAVPRTRAALAAKDKEVRRMWSMPLRAAAYVGQPTGRHTGVVWLWQALSSPVPAGAAVCSRRHVRLPVQGQGGAQAR